MGMGFQFGQHRLGLWDLSWDLKKTISWEMGLGLPLHDPPSNLSNRFHEDGILLIDYTVEPSPGCDSIHETEISQWEVTVFFSKSTFYTVNRTFETWISF